MAVPGFQGAFSAGEISPELYGQVELAKFRSAASTLRNAFVSYKGGALSRGGLAFVGRCKQSVFGGGPPRPVTFQFSITQGYALEFGSSYLRFVYQGGYVLENPVSITGATQANPCQISVAGTPFANGDWVFFAGVGGMTQLNGNTYIVAGAGSGSFTLQDLNGNAVNSAAFGAYTAGGSVSRLYTIATPYAAADLPYLKYSQTADVMTLTCSNPASGMEYAPYELTRLSAINWTLAPCDFDPVIAPPSSLSAVANSQAPTTGINATFAYQVTAVDAKGNESIASYTASCHGADLEVEGGSNTITWTFVAGAQYYNIFRAPAVTDGTSGANPVPAGSIFGFVGSAYGTQYVDSASTVALTQTPPVHKNPFAPGQILAVQITGGGSGLMTATSTITTSSGVNFAGYPVVVGGSLGAFPIVNNGELYAPGNSIAFNGAGFATGAIQFGSTNPSTNDTVTLNGVVWTFVTAITGPNQTVIQGSLNATLARFMSDLSASSNPSLTVSNYAADVTNSNLIITYNAAGTAGNSYTLAASRATPSGATLSGGSGSGAAGLHASGTMTFSTNPANGQTIVLDGVTWTFVTAGATGNQTNIGGSLAATLTALQANLTASANANIALANYAVSATVLSIAYKTVGVVGNTYTLGAGTYGATLSGPTLMGGADASTVPTATLVIGPTSGVDPGVNAYFQQRRFFACSLNNPDTLWASQTGLYSNFDNSIPSKATDAITASPWTEQVNGIQWLIPMPGGLIAMTGNRAWQIIGEGSYQLNVQPVTPATTQAQPQAFNGCSSTIPPIVIDDDLIYVEALSNSTVRDLSWNFYVNIYTGADLTILSSQLFQYRQLTQWTWARNPYKVLWAAANDGAFLSMTYLKEQEVYGWARHDTQGLVVGLCSVTEPPINAVYAVVKRFPPYAVGGIYVMERMDGRVWQSIEDAFAVDSAVANPISFPNTDITASTSSGAVSFGTGAGVFTGAAVGQVIRLAGGIATITAYTDSQHISGAWNLNPTPGPAGFPYATSGFWSIAAPVNTLNAPHLAGMTVNALADGVPILGLPVGGAGLITLPFAASNVKAGLPFVAQVQTAYLNGPQVVQGARKVIPAATVRVSASTKFQVGTNQPDGAAQNPPTIGSIWTGLATFDPLNATGGQVPASTYTSPGGRTVTQLWTGDIRGITGGAAWESKGQVAVQQTLPMALEVIAIEPEYLPGDIPEASYEQRAPQGQPQPSRGPGRWMIGAGGPRI